MVVIDLGFCPQCGGSLESSDGEGRRRLRCSVCGFTVYRNPLPVVVVAVVDDDRALFVKRARAPEKGCWSLPGGYLEINEPPQAGAARELLEETGLEVDPNDLAFAGTIHEPLDEDLALVDIVFTAPIEKTDGEPVASDDAAEVAFWPREEIAKDPETLRVGDITLILWAIDTFGDDRVTGMERYFPEKGFGFDLRQLASATVTRTTEQNPLAPLARLETLFLGATTARFLSFTIGPSPTRRLWQRVLAGEATVTIVLDDSALEIVRDEPGLTRMVQEMLDTDRTEFLVHDDVSYLLALVDDTAVIGLSTDQGGPYALIESDEDAVIDWVASTIETYIDEGSPVDRHVLSE